MKLVNLGSFASSIQASIAAGAGGGVVDHTIWCTGINTSGELGLDDKLNRSSPVQFGDYTTVNTASFPNGGIAVTLTSGECWATGYNGEGQLGQNTNNGGGGSPTDASSPVQVGNLTDWNGPVQGPASTEVGRHFVKSDSTLWGWGVGSGGTLGNGTSTHRSSPIQIGALTDWSTTPVGGYTSAGALKSDGTIWAWGRNAEGQLGNGTVVKNSSPIQIGASTGWTSVAKSYLFMAGIDGGKLYAWGANDMGQLGQGDVVNRSTPTQIGAATDWASVGIGQKMVLAVKTDGTLWTFGNNDSGQLGHGDIVPRSSPVQVGSATDWSQTDGYYSSIFLKTTGTIWTCGQNTSAGTLMHNDNINRSTPTQVGALTNYTHVAMGQLITVAFATS